MLVACRSSQQCNRFAFMNYASKFVRNSNFKLRKLQTLYMSSSVHENVKNYYGSRLGTSEDLQTNAACVMPCRPLPKSACEALKQVHPDVCKRYFGCGLVVPEKLEGCQVLDLGSGSGRDCYVISKLVGATGHVIGLDMTDEMIVASQNYVQYHREKFGFSKANTVFVKGYMEKLGEAGIQDNSLDVVV